MDSTWIQPNTTGGYVCQYCNQWVWPGTWHTCNWTAPKAPETYPLNSGMAELMMYGDFKKLLKRDVLQKFRERFLDSLADIEERTVSPASFDLGAIEDIFDDVAKGFYDDASV